MAEEMTEDFISYFYSLPKEEQDALLSRMARDFDTEEGGIEADLERAADMEADRTRGRRAGGMYVAADPLEHIASVGRRVQGQEVREGAEKRRTELGEARAEQRMVALEESIREMKAMMEKREQAARPGMPGAPGGPADRGLPSMAGRALPGSVGAGGMPPGRGGLPSAAPSSFPVRPGPL